MEHVTATISSCQPEERLHAKRGSPNPPNENKRQTQGERTRARRSRRGQADAVPSRPVRPGRTRHSHRTDAVAVAWRGPRRRRCERRRRRPPGLACGLWPGLPSEVVAARRVEWMEPRPSGRQVGLGRSSQRLAPAACNASGRPATCRSWSLTGSLPVPGPFMPCGCGRRMVRFFSPVFWFSSRWSRQSSHTAATTASV